LRLPDGVHGMLPTSETSALALRWNLDRRVGSILRLDLTQILQPRVIEEIAVGDQFPSSATRSGNLVAVRMEASDSRHMVPDTYLLVRNALDQPLALLGSIASSQEGSWVPSRLFVDQDRGYLSTQSSFLVEGTTSYETRYRTQVYDMATLPPRSLGDLPFQVTALTRIGDDVFALLPSPSSLRSTLATVSLSDPPAASSILQRINLLGNSPLWDDPGADIGEITALPDGSLVMPVMTWSGNQSRPYEYFLQRFQTSLGRHRLRLSDEAVEAIRDHDWPGNVAELGNALKQAVITAEGPTIKSADLGLASQTNTRLISLREAREDAERDAVQKALKRVNGNIARASEMLGISRPTLYDLLNKLGMR